MYMFDSDTTGLMRNDAASSPSTVRIGIEAISGMRSKGPSKPIRPFSTVGVKNSAGFGTKYFLLNAICIV